MGSIQTPVGGPTDPSDRSFRPPPIDPDQEARDEKEKEAPPQQERIGITAYVLQMFQRALDFILSGGEKESGSETSAREHLVQFKALLEFLKVEDRSQDLPFLNRLSKTWLTLLEDGLHFESDKAEAAFKMLVKKLQHYPENQPHSFAYYLTENTNQKWIPFPYMELIQKIHAEHQKNPKTSPLAEWTALLGQLIHLLQPE